MGWLVEFGFDLTYRAANVRLVTLPFQLEGFILNKPCVLKAVKEHKYAPICNFRTWPKA